MIIRVIAYLIAFYSAMIASEGILYLRIKILGEKKRRYDFISTIIFVSQNILKAITAVIAAFLILKLFSIEYSLFMSILLFVGIARTEIQVIREAKFSSKLHVTSILSWLFGLSLATYLFLYNI